MGNNVSGNAEEEINALRKIIEKKDYQIMHLKRNFDLADKLNVRSLLIITFLFFSFLLFSIKMLDL